MEIFAKMYNHTQNYTIFQCYFNNYLKDVPLVLISSLIQLSAPQQLLSTPFCLLQSLTRSMCLLNFSTVSLNNFFSLSSMLSLIPYKNQMLMQWIWGFAASMRMTVTYVLHKLQSRLLLKATLEKHPAYRSVQNQDLYCFSCCLQDYVCSLKK